jgi:hypothetical protein
VAASLKTNRIGFGKIQDEKKAVEIPTIAPVEILQKLIT